MLHQDRKILKDTLTRINTSKCTIDQLGQKFLRFFSDSFRSIYQLAIGEMDLEDK